MLICTLIIKKLLMTTLSQKKYVILYLYIFIFLIIICIKLYHECKKCINENYLNLVYLCPVLIKYRMIY